MQIVTDIKVFLPSSFGNETQATVLAMGCSNVVLAQCWQPVVQTWYWRSAGCRLFKRGPDALLAIGCSDVVVIPLQRLGTCPILRTI
jgi:hypothetical protein